MSEIHRAIHTAGLIAGDGNDLLVEAGKDPAFLEALAERSPNLLVIAALGLGLFVVKLDHSSVDRFQRSGKILCEAAAHR